MSEPIIVIVNPASGSHDTNFRQEIEAALQNQGIAFQIRETTPERRGDILAAEAVAAGARHIVACGGDGTVMAVVNGLGKSLLYDTGQTQTGQTQTGQTQTGQTHTRQPVEPQVTLSIIPGGTANLLATALEIPPTIAEAVAVIATGRDRVIDLGCCGKHLFALGLGLGLTERLVSQTSAREKEKIGKLAYARAMLRELGSPPSTFEFKLDDGPLQRTRGVAVVVANTGDIGGNLQFAPDAKMDDGRLDLCILHRFYFRDVLRMAWLSLTGRLPEDRAVSFHQARRLEIRSTPPLDLQIDGEEVEQQTPLVATILPGALQVRVPRTEAS